MKTFKMFLHENNVNFLETRQNVADHDTLVEVAKLQAFKFKVDQLKEVFEDDLEEPFDVSRLNVEQTGCSHSVGPVHVVNCQVTYKDLEQHRWWTYDMTVTFVQV